MTFGFLNLALNGCLLNVVLKRSTVTSSSTITVSFAFFFHLSCLTLSASSSNTALSLHGRYRDTTPLVIIRRLSPSMVSTPKDGKCKIHCPGHFLLYWQLYLNWPKLWVYIAPADLPGGLQGTQSYMFKKQNNFCFIKGLCIYQAMFP